MAFIVGSIIIGAGAAVASGALGAKGAKDAASTAAAGSTEEIAFNRESRDLARSDQAPYREAGTTALNALMSMTGLGGGPQEQAPAAAPRGARRALRGPSRYGGAQIPSDQNFTASGRQSSYGSDGSLDNYGRAYGGSIQGRAHGGGHSSGVRRMEYSGHAEGGPLYNVNELAPENIFENGSYTRSTMPKTIPPSATGYVGRADGGSLGVADPRGSVTGGGIIPGGTPTGTYGPGPKEGAPGDYVNSSIPDKGGTTIDGATGYPVENPGGVEGGYNFQTDPGYQFRFEEGQRALDRGAAASGGLLSGGYGRKAIRYGQNFASNEYANVYNRISNIAGLGQVAAGQSGQAALYGGAQMGGAASDRSLSTAYGQQGQANAWGSAIDQIGQLPWEKIM